MSRASTDVVAGLTLLLGNERTPQLSHDGIERELALNEPGRELVGLGTGQLSVHDSPASENRASSDLTEHPPALAAVPLMFAATGAIQLQQYLK
jgi:hypothetical protein